MASTLQTNVPNDLKVGNNIISTTIPAALTKSADIFGRQKISTQQTLFWSTNAYDKEPLRWNELITGTASSSAPTNGVITLSATGATGKIVRQSKLYVPYFPGKSQYFSLGGNLNVSLINGVTTRIGSFDSTVEKTGGSAPDVNEGSGHFFSAEQVAGGVVTYYVVQRSSITGSQVDTKVARASWNLDPLDGSGDSKITVDFTKTQIFAIERAWLGVGSVRMGVYYGGAIIWCHQFFNENTTTGTYMARAALPIRYEIVNTGAVTAATMFQGACSAYVDGDSSDYIGLPFSYIRSAVVSVNNATEAHMFTLRLQAAKPRTFIRFNRLEASATTGTSSIATIFVRFNSTFSVAPTFTAIANSSIERAETATITTAGTLLASINVSANGNADDLLNLAPIYLGAGFAGITQDTITITCSLPIGGVATSVLSSLNWEEFN
jgi:hypothetical protein